MACRVWVAQGTPDLVATPEEKGFYEGRETIRGFVGENVAISWYTIDLDGVIQKGDWIDWEVLTDEDNVFPMVTGFGLGETEKVGMMVTRGFSETR